MQSNAHHFAVETSGDFVVSDFNRQQSRELRVVVIFKNLLHPFWGDRGRAAIRRQWNADDVAQLALDGVDAVEERSLG